MQDSENSPQFNFLSAILRWFRHLRDFPAYYFSHSHGIGYRPHFCKIFWVSFWGCLDLWILFQCSILRIILIYTNSGTVNLKSNGKGVLFPNNASAQTEPSYSVDNRFIKIGELQPTKERYDKLSTRMAMFCKMTAYTEKTERTENITRLPESENNKLPLCHKLCNLYSDRSWELNSNWFRTQYSFGERIIRWCKSAEIHIHHSMFTLFCVRLCIQNVPDQRLWNFSSILARRGFSDQNIISENNPSVEGNHEFQGVMVQVKE